MGKSFVVGLGVLMATVSCMGRELELPAIPGELREPSARASWLLEHFFDNMEWNSPVSRADTLYIEQNLANFFSVMPATDSIGAAPGAARLIEGAAGAEGAPELVASLSSIYLNTTASPCFFEEGYLVMADAILSRPEGISRAEIERVRFQKDELMKNRVGSRSADFRYIDRNGSEQTLYGTAPVDGERLLIFYDQECGDCLAELRKLASDSATAARIADGRLTLTVIEAFGADADEWITAVSDWPAVWQVGRSPEGEVEENEIYIMRRNPTKYLLDAQGRVIAKDFE